MQSDLLQNRKPVLGTPPRTYLACLPKSKRSPGSLRNRSVTWRSTATYFSDEPLCRAASRSSNREPSPRGMAVTHKLKTDAGAGLRRNARDPPPHIPVIQDRADAPARRQPPRAHSNSVLG